MRPAIFIDDSGNPGTKTENIYDSTDRKSWYALILTAEERIGAMPGMTSLIEQNKRIYGANEFHFTDIFSGTKAYKGLSIDNRMNIFVHFAEIFRQMKYPLMHMTMTSADYQRAKILLPEKKFKIDGFDMGNHEHLALYYLLLRCNGFLKANRKGCPPSEVIVDEGRQKDGSTQRLDNFHSKHIDKMISYVSSKKEPMLQLADYAAFCLNKCYWLQNKPARTELDENWLKIFAYADFQILSMERRYSDVRSDTKSWYEQRLSEEYRKYDDASDIELEEMLGQLEWKKDE